jgi:hypothetical protein
VGDIDLLREIRLDKRSIADYHCDRPRVRRVYTAKIEGRKSEATVAVYQGEGAHEVSYIYYSPLYTDYATISGMAGGHGTLLPGSVRKNHVPHP